MGSKSKALYDSINATDDFVGDYDYGEVEELEAISLNKSARQHKSDTKKVSKKKRAEKTSANSPVKVTIDSPISSKPVRCKCNKCGEHVSGELLSIIYSPLDDKYFPYISYYCRNCYHAGRRSVYSLALPKEKFEQLYLD